MNDLTIALAISMLFNVIQIAVNSYITFAILLKENKSK